MDFGVYLGLMNIFSIVLNKYLLCFYLPGLPRKTEEYNRLEASAFLVSAAGDDHSLRHHRPEKPKEKTIVIHTY